MSKLEFSHSWLSEMLEMGYKLWKSSCSTGEYDQVVQHQKPDFKNHPSISMKRISSKRKRSKRRRRLMIPRSMKYGWSDLPMEMIEHITSFLPLPPDQHRFSAVCHNWHNVAKQTLCCPPLDPMKLPPWLILGEDSTTKKRNFYSPSEQRHYSIDVPELYGQYIFGSSYGWLFIVDKTANGRLLNPFTREFYDLPCFPSYYEWLNFRRISQKVKDITDMVSKGVLTHDPRERSDFIAAIVFGEYYFHDIAIWRQGDPQFSIVNLIHYDTPGTVADVICFRGKVYVLFSNNQIYVVDVGLIPKVTRVFNCLFDNPKSLPISTCLVDLREKLLLVIKLKNIETHPPMHYYRVFHCNPVGDLFYEVDVFDHGLALLNEVDHLDGLALFVGVNSAIVVDPSDYPEGCVNDCIYFGDVGKQGHEFGVFSMVDKTVTQLGARDDLDHLFNPPDAKLMWITPNRR